METTGNQIQKDTSALSTKDWLITLIITSIPFIGFIMLLVWAFSDGTNVNKSNYAKAALLLFVIIFALGILFSLIFGAGMFALFNEAGSSY